MIYTFNMNHKTTWPEKENNLWPPCHRENAKAFRTAFHKNICSIRRTYIKKAYKQARACH